MRAAWGTICLLAPSRVSRSLGGPVDQRTLAVTRLLGVRHLLQGWVYCRHPSRSVFAVGGVVDLLHSASMGVLGAMDPARRRLAWSDSLIAAGWGAVSLHDSPRVEWAVGPSERR
jgi:hypothetical protein